MKATHCFTDSLKSSLHSRQPLELHNRQFMNLSAQPVHSFVSPISKKPSGQMHFGGSALFPLQTRHLSYESEQLKHRISLHYRQPLPSLNIPILHTQRGGFTCSKSMQL